MRHAIRRSWCCLGALLLAFLFGCDGGPSRSDSGSAEDLTTPAITVQLNWLHDPTFVGQYELGLSNALRVSVREGGPNVSPLAEVLARRAQFAIVGADIFLKYLGENPTDPGRSELVCVFVEFQRNPVGWVVHPDVAKQLGLEDAIKNDAKRLNKWIADQIRAKRIEVGDKRGTESTSAWLQWRAKQSLSPATPLTPVGFDSSVVLSAPRILYPVYLNEQPFKLSERTLAEGKGSTVVIDPSVDGVRLLGNVIVARRDFLENSPTIVTTFQAEMRKAWWRVKADPEKASRAVRSRYSGVSAETVMRQVSRTLEFVFVEGREPGTMDLTSTGDWTVTLRSLQEAGSVSRDVTAEQLFLSLAPPK